MAKQTKAQKAERDEFIAKLREVLPEGSTVYTILRSVSASGMSRTMDVIAIRNNEPMRLTYWVAKAIEHRYDERREAMVVPGAGMDMGFHVADCLSWALYGKGGAINHRWL